MRVLQIDAAAEQDGDLQVGWLGSASVHGSVSRVEIVVPTPDGDCPATSSDARPPMQ
jgi:hypothetical protein